VAGSQSYVLFEERNEGRSATEDELGLRRDVHEVDLFLNIDAQVSSPPWRGHDAVSRSAGRARRKG